MTTLILLAQKVLFRFSHVQHEREEIADEVGGLWGDS